MAEATEEHVIAHLRDVHALEEQSAKLFEIAADELAEDDELVQLYRERLDQSREHEQQINERIEAHDCKPSAVKDLTMSAASSVGLRDLSDKPVDTPVKLTMNFVALQHLKIAGYELLVRIAKDAGDDETSRTAEQLLEQEC